MALPSKRLTGKGQDSMIMASYFFFFLCIIQVMEIICIYRKMQPLFERALAERCSFSLLKE